MTGFPEIIQDSGIWAYLLFGMTLLTVVVLIPVTLALRCFTSKTPAILWCLGPVTLVALGLVGTGVGFVEAAQAMEHVPESDETPLLASTTVLALSTTKIAALLASGLSCLIALVCSGFIAVRADDWAGKTPVIATIGIGVVGGGSLVGAGVVVGTGIADMLREHGIWIYLLFFVYLAGLATTVLAVLRKADDDDQPAAVAGDRLAAVASFVFATACTGVAATIAHLHEGFMALETAPPEDRTRLLSMTDAAASQAMQMGIVATIIAALVAAVALLVSHESLSSRQRVIEATGAVVLVMLLAAGAGFAFVQSQQAPFFESLDELFDDPDAYGSDRGEFDEELDKGWNDGELEPNREY